MNNGQPDQTSSERVPQAGEGAQAQIQAQKQAAVPEQAETGVDRLVWNWFALPDRVGPDVPDLPAEASDGRPPPLFKKPRTVDFDFLAKLSPVQQRDTRQPEQGS